MDLISQLLSAQFPLWIQQNGPNTVAFIEAYYEFMQQTPNPEYWASTLLSNRDIDTCLDQFLQYFQYEFCNSLPANIAANKRLLIKHIIDLYQSKGTKRGFALLFRILFNENIEVYLPGQDIFTTSGNQWVQPIYLEVNDSPFLSQLVGQSIYGLNTGATALVESYDVLWQNDKVINILSISNVKGLFLYGDSIYSKDVPYSNKFAPLIVGSLSSVGIINGGIDWNVGDLVNISGTGLSKATGGLGRVASTTFASGKVIFDLEFGGFGYTKNAVIQVLGGGGTGASFKVGTLVDQQVYAVNIDVINGYLNTQLDISSEGFTLGLANVHGTFTVGELITATSANSMQFDFTYVTSNNMAVGEALSNTVYGISGLQIVNLQNPNFLTVIGNYANLQAVVGSTIFVSNTTSSRIFLNSIMNGIQQNSTNGQITAANSTSITVEASNNYFLPTANVIGLSSGANGTVTTVTRDTDWAFPQEFVIGNLDTPINQLLEYENLVIGTIASLIDEDPGAQYGSNPTVVVEEPLIADLVIPDGQGGYWGIDAVVTANAIFANGIATSVQIIASSYGFEPGDQLIMTSPNNSISSITGSAVVDSYGVSQGYWTSNASFLSDINRLQDSHYYQPFSFEVRSERSMSEWANTILNLMSPVGYAMFAKFAIHDNKAIQPAIVYEGVTAS